MPGGGCAGVREHGERVRERERGMLRAQHRARRGRRAFADDDRRRARAPQRRRVPGVREKREVALARLLEPGHAADFQRAIAFEPASQPLG